MKSIYSISEEQQMHIAAIISSIPRRTLQEFQESILGLKPEELKYLKRELSFLVSKGDKRYLAALNYL